MFCNFCRATGDQVPSETPQSKRIKGLPALKTGVCCNPADQTFHFMLLAPVRPFGHANLGLKWKGSKPNVSATPTPTPTPTPTYYYSYSLLPTTYYYSCYYSCYYYLLPTTYYLLPTTYCLLPSIYHLLSNATTTVENHYLTLNRVVAKYSYKYY